MSQELLPRYQETGQPVGTLSGHLNIPQLGFSI
jgi:hypothetical protein